MNKSERFAALDGLRGVAAIVVVIWHLFDTGQPPVPSGYLAVDLFFMLSGFVLAFAYGDRLKADYPVVRGFLVQRFIRLWPLYLAGLAVGVSVFSYGVMRGWDHPTGVSFGGTVLANLFFLP